MYSFLLNREIKEETLSPCYFFYGEETFLAHQFVHELRDTLVSPDTQSYALERFDLEDSSWAEIIDLARTIPFFFSPWRIILVEDSEGKRENLSPLEEEILRGYFSSPSSKTILVIVFYGKINKNSPLFRFFSSLPSSSVGLKELRPLKDKALFAWVEKKFASLEKRATLEAEERLVEKIGNDLRRLSSEIEKVATFVDEKKVIDLDDINQVSDWVKAFFEWELSNSLEKANFDQCLMVLNNLFKEGTKPEYIVGIIANFFRDLLTAKVWLAEKKKDRKEIFRELKPNISEKFRNLYLAKFKEFFALVEMLSEKDLNRTLAELEMIDLKIKTSDVSPQALLESFLFDYCCLQKEERRRGEPT